MPKPDYERKALVLQNGDYDAYRFSRQIVQSTFQGIPLSENNPFESVEDAFAFDKWKSEYDSENWQECKRLDHARIQRVVRLKSRVRWMICTGNCCFVTLTFSEDVLANTSEKTRHEYVKRWLRLFPSAIANIDFGSENGREHYHALVKASRVSLDSWKYGFLFSKSIKQGDKKNIDKVACYVAKLVNHAIKETTKGCRTIYSGYFGPKDHLPKKNHRLEDISFLSRYEPEEPDIFEQEVFTDVPADILQEIQSIFAEV